jgi:8-oxo-dGTP pyrophosphatase MutT (NUDIX family)
MNLNLMQTTQNNTVMPQEHLPNQWRNQIVTQRNNPFSRLNAQRPQPGKAEVYGAIIKSTVSNKYCLVEGARSGKWSLPKGHRNIFPGDPPIIEDPFACVVREVGEEIGIDKLPMPLREVPLRVGYYYMFEVPFELPLNPRDTNEVGQAGWFSVQEMGNMNLNIDASLFRRQLLGRAGLAK